LKPRTILTQNGKLRDIEAKVILDPSGALPNDAYNLPPMSKLNIEHSVHLHQPVYGIASDPFVKNLRKFSTMGGKFFFVPPDRELNPFQFGIYESDLCYPVCTDGLNRSQILYLLLQGIKRSLGIPEGKENIVPPHGALFGFDSISDDENQKFAMEEDRSWFHQCFFQGFNTNTTPRFGETFGKSLEFKNSRREWKRGEKNRQTMKEYFDLYYYHPKKPKNSSNRFIYFCFQQSMPVVLRRLMEINEKYEDIVLIGIPLGEDMIVDINSSVLKKTQLKREQYCVIKLGETYRQYATLFSPTAS